MAEYICVGEIMLRLKSPANERFFNRRNLQQRLAAVTVSHRPWFTGWIPTKIASRLWSLLSQRVAWSIQYRATSTASRFLRLRSSWVVMHPGVCSA